MAYKGKKSTGIHSHGVTSLGLLQLLPHGCPYLHPGLTCASCTGLLAVSGMPYVPLRALHLLFSVWGGLPPGICTLLPVPLGSTGRSLSREASSSRQAGTPPIPHSLYSGLFCFITPKKPRCRCVRLTVSCSWTSAPRDVGFVLLLL